jgi:hypothetical protein
MDTVDWITQRAAHLAGANRRARLRLMGEIMKSSFRSLLPFQVSRKRKRKHKRSLRRLRNLSRLRRGRASCRS